MMFPTGILNHFFETQCCVILKPSFELVFPCFWNFKIEVMLTGANYFFMNYFFKFPDLICEQDGGSL